MAASRMNLLCCRGFVPIGPDPKEDKNKDKLKDRDEGKSQPLIGFPSVDSMERHEAGGDENERVEGGTPEKSSYDQGNRPLRCVPRRTGSQAHHICNQDKGIGKHRKSRQNK